MSTILPSNSQLTHLVDYRIDYGVGNLFEHFESLAADVQIGVPTLRELRCVARALHKRFGTQRAWVAAMAGGAMAAEAGWKTGSLWDEREARTGADATNSEVLRPDTADLSTGAGGAAGDDHGQSEVTEVQAEVEALTRDDAASDGSMSASGSEDSDSESTDSSPMFQGDRTLAQSILFMSDAIVLRDLSQAVSEGDIGRVWNNLKVTEHSHRTGEASC